MTKEDQASDVNPASESCPQASPPGFQGSDQYSVSLEPLASSSELVLDVG